MNVLVAPMCGEDSANHQIVLETSTGTVIIGNQTPFKTHALSLSTSL